MRSSRRTGFALLTMTVVVALLGVFALVSVEVFRTAFTSIQRSQESQTVSILFDNMLQQMREDTWGAPEVRVESDRVVRLGPVTWSVARDGTVYRQGGGSDARAWRGLGPSLSFEASPAGLSLHVREAGGEERLLLQSQVPSNGRRP